MINCIIDFLKRMAKTVFALLVLYFCLGAMSGIFGFSIAILLVPTSQVLIGIGMFEYITRKQNEGKLKSLENVSTKDLVSVLSKRGGVEEEWLQPYEKKQIDVEGPMIVLKVID